MTAALLSLGGPGPGCSRHKLRLLDAGELDLQEAAALRAHAAGCLRCQATQAEIARERAELPNVLPFDAFAAGVAEKLATPERPSSRARFVRVMQFAAPMAIAAALLVVVVPLLRTAPVDTDRNRTKGEAGAALFVKDDHSKHELAAGEAVALHAQLLVSLRPAGHRFAAAVLWEKAGTESAVSVLYAGDAKPGPLPTAFEWDGHGQADIVVRYADAPVDAAAFVTELQKNGPPSGTSDTTVIPLSRP